VSDTKNAMTGRDDRPKPGRGIRGAGQRVTLRLRGNVMAVLAGHRLLGSLPCTVAPQDRAQM
jgi:hypothetical protein